MSNTFEPLPIPQKDAAAAQVAQHTYHVYKSPEEFVPVSAPTALEALKNCGFERVYKIERYTLDSSNVLDPSASAKVLLNEKEEAPAAEAAADKPAEAPAAADPATPA